MALSDATRLADFATGVGTDGTLSANNINATGIITAASFDGVSGFATALSSTKGDLLNNIFKTQYSQTVGAGTSILIESDAVSGNVAFTRLASITVSSGATCRVGSGTTFAMNVLGVF
jgi:hypothetical protein